MRSSRSLVTSLLAAGLALVPLHAAAQEYAFVVTPSKVNPKMNVEVKVVQNCKNDGAKLICDVIKAKESNVVPGGKGTSLGNLTYGVTSKSPDCVWFYDWTKNTRYEVCW